jgi:hypothetical protein
MADALLSMVNSDLLRLPGALFDIYTSGSLPPALRLSSAHTAFKLLLP